GPWPGGAEELAWSGTDYARPAPAGTGSSDPIVTRSWLTTLSAPPPLLPWGIGAYVPRLQSLTPQQRSADVRRKKIDRCGFQPNNRYTNFPAVRTTWHGRRTNALRNALHSRPGTHASSGRRPSAQRPAGSGRASAHQAFRFHARAVITMYAQLLSSVSDGAFSARTPPCSCASRFSWSQRSLAANTT